MTRLTPSHVLGAGPAPAVTGQLDLFAEADQEGATCAGPATCTDYDPCGPCLTEARTAGLTQAGHSETTGRNHR